MGETTFEMAKRHVREAEIRVACQRELAAELRRDGHLECAEAADALLAMFVAITASYKEHLRQLRGKAGLL